MSAGIPTILWWAAPLAGICGAAIVAAAGFFVQRWRYRTDRVGLSIDHLCNEINSAADTATTYWLHDPNQRAEKSDAVKLEPLLIGRQLRLQQLLLALKMQDHHIDVSSVEASMPDLVDAMTGGNFKSSERKSEPTRAQEVQAIAARMNGELRIALSSRNKRWR